MSEDADRVEGARDPEHRERLKRAVMELFEGSGLRVQEQTYELVISNPDAQSRGDICVDFEDFQVSWRRRTWDHFGQLEGFAEADSDIATAQKIVDTLARRG